MLGDRSAVTVVFERGSASAEAHAVFFERRDLPSHDSAFLIALPTRPHRLGRILRLEFHHRPPLVGVLETLPANDVSELSEGALIDYIEQVFAACLGKPNIRPIHELLTRRIVGFGCIDNYGYHFPSRGWVFRGWIANNWIALGEQTTEIVAHFDSGECTGPAVRNYFEREDTKGTGTGILIHLSTLKGDPGRLEMLTLRAGAAVFVLKAPESTGMIPRDKVAESFLSFIANSDPGCAHNALRNLASRVAYDGRDTIAELTDSIFVGLDEAISCTPDSIILIGWILARSCKIKTIRLNSTDHSFPLDIETDILWVHRDDVIETVGRQHGFDDPRCGFLARVPTAQPVTGDLHLEIETVRGEVGFIKLPPRRLDGIPAMKRILNCIDAQYADVNAIYEHIVGPAIRALNVQRLLARPDVQALQLGEPVLAPRYSVIVSLYGRVDFMALQMALFTVRGIGRDVEIIYVLDDPPRIRETQFLAASLYERFRLPFRLLCLSRNVGLAPANNIGMAAASGQFTCFMNSDVFPTSGDWLDRLAEHLETDPTLGVVGPVLLFEDDSVQHQGISFKNLPQFGNWAFPQHKRKGFRVLPMASKLVRETAITGACILLRRESILTCGGFDESFIIGYFEDTDL
jgi:Glycosyl transferase family 2